MESRCCVYVWRSGLRHWSPGGFIVRDDGSFIGDPPPAGANLLVVDSEVYSGMTLLRVSSALKQRGYAVQLAASPATGTQLPQEVVRLDAPLPNAPLVAVCGLPGSGKSAIARMLQGALGAVYYKWARFLRDPGLRDPGLYGEKAAELENKDPLVFAKTAWHSLVQDPHRPVILDGPKDHDVLTFLAFSTRRPLIPLWISVDETIRQQIVSLRNDPDDRFDQKRIKLFAKKLDALRSKSIVVDLAVSDHSEALKALAWHGLKLPLGVGNCLMDKRWAVYIPLYNARSGASTRIFPDELVQHRYYSTRYGLSGVVAERVNVVASALRLIDDIIDCHTQRRFRQPDGSVVVKPAVWVTQSPWMAVMWASAMLAWANAGDPHYNNMLNRIAAATLVELQAEREHRRLTTAEYIQSLDKESAFRFWIAQLAGLDPVQLENEGRNAQMENDIYASATEARRLPCLQ